MDNNKVMDALLSTVFILRGSLFPFHHTTSSAIEARYYQECLVPDGYLKFADCRSEYDTCYEITRKGYELIRGFCGRDLQAQGDAYYGLGVVE